MSNWDFRGVKVPAELICSGQKRRFTQVTTVIKGIGNDLAKTNIARKHANEICYFTIFWSRREDIRVEEANGTSCISMSKGRVNR